MPNQPLYLKSLPLFPLGAVLFPDGEVPLRVFEARYLDVIVKCHNLRAPFGVVTLTRGSEVRTPDAAREQFEAVGTLATITHLEQAQPGLLLIQCRGGQRFQIEQSSRLKNGLWVADAVMLAPDAAVKVPGDLLPIAQMLRQLFDGLRLHRAPVPRPEDTRYDDCGWVANRWAELLPMPLATRQRLMALDSPLVRLELMADMLTRNGIGSGAER